MTVIARRVPWSNGSSGAPFTSLRIAAGLYSYSPCTERSISSTVQECVPYPIDRRSNSRNGESSSQARDRAGQAAHLHDPAGGVVVLGEHAHVLVLLAEQFLLRVGQHQTVLHHCGFE